MAHAFVGTLVAGSPYRHSPRQRAIGQSAWVRVGSARCCYGHGRESAWSELIFSGTRGVDRLARQGRARSAARRC
jgi:hypothetical protein